MKLLTLNVDNDYFIECIKDQTDGQGEDVLFIDWLPTTNMTQDVTNQIHIVESTPDDVKMIVFDRHSALTNDEVDFFKNRGSILLEPVLRPRFGFLFMPYYLNRIDLPLSTWDKDRPFDFGYKGDSLSSATEAILLKTIKEVKDLCVGVSVKNHLSKERYDTLREVIGFGNYGWDKFNTTIITGSEQDYYRGRLPDITNHLKFGVVPLIHHKHKWYHALFKSFVILDHNDVSWYKNMFRSIHYGMMDEMYKNIEMYLPQMFTENFVKIIISLCED